MFVLTTLVYPVVLALLCIGAGLLVDRASGSYLRATLIPVAGASALIAVSQLTTYAAPIAPATPYLLVAIMLAGFALGWPRLRVLVGVSRSAPWQLVVGPLAYVLALAPVLLAGRPSLSAYMVLADSAYHLLGADFLIHHGQDYTQLDPHNSVGATIAAYYGTSYPSGADTLFGASSLLVRLPLLWTFQPFNAFMLALVTGPTWVLVRHIGLRGAWAALATLTVTLPALVYAYELIGSVKEIAALPLILGMGALVVDHRRWLWSGARAALPFALLIAAGVAALGVAFGAWALAATIVLVFAASARLLGARRANVTPSQEHEQEHNAHGAANATPQHEHDDARAAPSARSLGALLAMGVLVLLIAAWPTWAQLSSSLHVAQAIASTSNPGNLRSPLHPSQLLGIWLSGSYKRSPNGVALTLSWVLIAIVLVLAVVGLGYVVRTGRYALAGWFALTLVLWLALDTYATTWATAKTLMLTSSAVMLMAWAGIAALRASPVRITATLVAFLVLAGVLVSDALQYNESNLAPTARYEELASIDARYAGRGPTLFTDFDEYALEQLYEMDVGGPNFAYPPPALAHAVAGHGRPVRFEHIAPAALLAYPLIVTRRDPTVARPPAAYRLLWRGSYYEVWARRRATPPALEHIVLSGPPRALCAHARRLVLLARSRHLHVLAALAPEIVPVALPRSRSKRPPGWVRTRAGILMRRSGTLSLTFRLPHAGMWELWLHGDVMRALQVAVDGRRLGSLGAQLDGNSLVLNALTPLRARLSAGSHTLAIIRPSASLAPGDGGAALLSGVFLTPAPSGAEAQLAVLSRTRARTLCVRPLQWVELVPKT